MFRCDSSWYKLPSYFLPRPLPCFLPRRLPCLFKYLLIQPFCYLSIAHVGESLAFSSDATWLAVAAPYDNEKVGAIFIFRRDSDGWYQQESKLVANDARGLQGNGLPWLTFSSDATWLAVGAPDDDGGNGAIIIFRRNGRGIYEQHESKLKSNDTSSPGEGKVSPSIGVLPIIFLCRSPLPLCSLLLAEVLSILRLSLRDLVNFSLQAILHSLVPQTLYGSLLEHRTTKMASGQLFSSSVMRTPIGSINPSS